MKHFLFASDRDCDADSPASWWCKPSGLGISVDKLNRIAALVYFLMAATPLVCTVGMGKPMSTLSPLYFDSCLAREGVLFLWALVALLPTMWMWVHASAYFEWSNMRFAPGSAEKTIEDAHFKLHADSAKALWAGVLALYGASFLGMG